MARRLGLQSAAGLQQLPLWVQPFLRSAVISDTDSRVFDILTEARWLAACGTVDAMAVLSLVSSITVEFPNLEAWRMAWTGMHGGGFYMRWLALIPRLTSLECLELQGPSELFAAAALQLTRLTQLQLQLSWSTADYRVDLAPLTALERLQKLSAQVPWRTQYPSQLTWLGQNGGPSTPLQSADKFLRVLPGLSSLSIGGGMYGKSIDMFVGIAAMTSLKALAFPYMENFPWMVCPTDCVARFSARLSGLTSLCIHHPARVTYRCNVFPRWETLFQEGPLPALRKLELSNAAKEVIHSTLANAKNLASLSLCYSHCELWTMPSGGSWVVRFTYTTLDVLTLTRLRSISLRYFDLSDFNHEFMIMVDRFKAELTNLTQLKLACLCRSFHAAASIDVQGHIISSVANLTGLQTLALTVAYNDPFGWVRNVVLPSHPTQIVLDDTELLQPLTSLSRLSKLMFYAPQATLPLSVAALKESLDVVRLAHGWPPVECVPFNLILF